LLKGSIRTINCTGTNVGTIAELNIMKKKGKGIGEERIKEKRKKKKEKRKKEKKEKRKKEKGKRKKEKEFKEMRWLTLQVSSKICDASSRVGAIMTASG